MNTDKEIIKAIQEKVKFHENEIIRYNSALNALLGRNIKEWDLSTFLKGIFSSNDHLSIFGHEHLCLSEVFHNELNAYSFLTHHRWEDGKPVCPHCGNRNGNYISPQRTKKNLPGYRCGNRKCDLPFNVRTGTFASDIKINLNTFLWMAHMILTGNYSSAELSRMFQISQKSAWFIKEKVLTGK